MPYIRQDNGDVEYYNLDHIRELYGLPKLKTILMTTIETLTAEKADLEKQIEVQQTVIITAEHNIKFLKKRLKVTEEQIKETPEEIKPVG